MLSRSRPVTALRWGELAGLPRTNCRTGDACILIDPDVGALHEVRGKMWLGPPKSKAAARRINLPAFLTVLLEEVMDSHDHDQIFIGPDGGWLRRFNFARRIWRPACDGVPAPGDGRGRIPPILPGVVFHGVRHHHKTILDELEVPEVLKHERMGHEMKGIQGVYSHLTTPIRERLITQLQQRWENSQP